LWLEANQNGGLVNLSNLVEYVFFQQYGFKIIKYLAANFDMVEILNNTGGYYRLRTPMVDNTGAPKTIGSIFAMIEGQKLDFNISEYAVSQTTLE